VTVSITLYVYPFNNFEDLFSFFNTRLNLERYYWKLQRIDSRSTNETSIEVIVFQDLSPLTELEVSNLILLMNADNEIRRFVKNIALAASQTDIKNKYLVFFATKTIMAAACGIAGVIVCCIVLMAFRLKFKYYHSDYLVMLLGYILICVEFVLKYAGATFEFCLSSISLACLGSAMVFR
jgi:hypothetical protein